MCLLETTMAKLVRWRVLTIAALLLWLLPAMVAQAARVRLMQAPDNPVHGEFVATLAASLPADWRIVGADAPAADLTVALGSEALRSALQQADKTPLLAALLTRRSFERLLGEFPPGERKVQALVLDQPAERQLTFVRQLFGEGARVGLLVSGETRSQLPALQRAGKERGLIVKEQEVDSESMLLPALDSLLPTVDLLLALPDAALFRRDNLRTVLMIAFRHRRPVVGYSAAFVQSGGIAALYSTPAQLASQAADLLLRPSAASPRILLPREYTVSVNRHVARTLDLDLPDEASLLRFPLARQAER